MDLIKFLLNLLMKNIPKSDQIERQMTSFEKYKMHTKASKSQSSLYSNLGKNEKNPKNLTFVTVVVQVSYIWQFFEASWIPIYFTVHAKEKK